MRIESTERLAFARRLATPRLLGTLVFLMLGAVLFCAIAGVLLVRQADERRDMQRRTMLLGAIEQARTAGVDFTSLDPRTIAGIGRAVGLDDLRFEVAPGGGERGLQSVLDAKGRIVGWFSWAPDRTLADALGELTPLIGATAVLLIGFAFAALGLVQRTVRDLRRSQERAWTLAHEDALTGLPNHRRMLELVDAALAARPHGDVVTLVLIDLDGMKDVNDSLGHEAGDALLRAVAARLRGLLPPAAACGRYDGNEFALAITAADAAAAEAVVERILAELVRPYWIAEQAVQVGATAGLAHAPRDGTSRDQLAKHADRALRAAKRRQRGGLMRFEPVMNAEFDERRFLERELRRAINHGDLDVHYQPIVAAEGGRIVGAEALLRWPHARRGAIAPADFVPVAERCGLMASLGQFVLRRALADAARWPDLYIAVNLSPVQVRAADLAEQVAAILAETGLAASRLVLEVTEGVLVDDPDEAKVRLERLRALGARLALDDFGTGYSSLTYLQRFRFDKLKIDKGFVAPLGRSAESGALVQAIVALGRALDLTLLAEGVETEEQRVLLRLAGCQEMQGYLFAQPGPREALDRLLRERAVDGPRAALRASG